MVEDIRRHHQLVGAGLADEIVEAAPHGFGRADDGAGLAVGKDRARVGIELRVKIRNRRRHAAPPSGPVVQCRLLQ